MIGLSNGDEFHFVVATWYPSVLSHFCSSFRCVVFPEPSGPSNAISRPRRRDGSAKCVRARLRASLLDGVARGMVRRRNHTLNAEIAEDAEGVRPPTLQAAAERFVSAPSAFSR